MNTKTHPITANPEAMFAGGRWTFLLGPGVTVTMDVKSVLDGWIIGDRYSLTASHSADRARHGKPVMVQLAHVLSATDIGNY